MGLLDRFVNPGWASIRRLSVDDQFEICFALVASVNLVLRIGDTLVAQFEGMASRVDRREWMRGGNRIVPMSFAMHSALAREATIAMLCCSPVDPTRSMSLRRIANEDLVQCIGLFVLAMHRASTPGVRWSTLEESCYAKQADEARAQCLIRWMDLLGLDDAGFVTVMNQTPFANEWNGCAGVMVSAVLESASKVDRAATIRGAESICREMPSSVVNIIIEWAKRVQRKQGR